MHFDRDVMFLDRSIRFVFRRSHFPRSKSPFHALACRIKQLMYKSIAVFAICDAHRQRSWELGSECRRKKRQLLDARKDAKKARATAVNSASADVMATSGQFVGVTGHCSHVGVTAVLPSASRATGKRPITLGALAGTSSAASLSADVGFFQLTTSTSAVTTSSSQQTQASR